MKNLLLILAIASHFSSALEPALKFDSQHNTYSLKLTSREVTTSMGIEQLISYSVYENKKFIFSELDGRRLLAEIQQRTSAAFIYWYHSGKKIPTIDDFIQSQ